MAWYIIESLDFEIKRNAFLYMYIFTVKAGVESVCGSGAYDSAPPPLLLRNFQRGKDCDCNAFREPTRHTNTVLHE